MKLFITIFLFASFLSTAFITKAQDDVYGTPSPVKQKKNNYPRKIKTGFVFIDGKYIDTPYKVKQKEPGKIYINNILVENRLKMTDTVLNPYKIDTLPPIPKSITKNTTFKEFDTIKYNNIPFYTAMGNYYNLHYPPKEARKKIIKYYRKIPCVKSFDGYTLELYNGEKQPICIDDVFHVEIYKNFGIHSNRKLPTKEEIYKKRRVLCKRY